MIAVMIAAVWGHGSCGSVVDSVLGLVVLMRGTVRSETRMCYVRKYVRGYYDKSEYVREY